MHFKLNYNTGYAYLYIVIYNYIYVRVHILNDELINSITYGLALKVSQLYVVLVLLRSGDDYVMCIKCGRPHVKRNKMVASTAYSEKLSIN